MRSRGDFGDALAEIRTGRVDAVFVRQTMTPATQRKLVDFVAKRRLPAMFVTKDYLAAGGLISYGPNFADLFRRAATYVDKILKGAKPADLPVEQPTTFELAINLRAATMLGLTVSPSVVARANQIIE